MDIVTQFARSHAAESANSLRLEGIAAARGVELAQLRALVLDCQSKFAFASAAFFADKAVSVSEGSPRIVQRDWVHTLVSLFLKNTLLVHSPLSSD